MRDHTRTGANLDHLPEVIETARLRLRPWRLTDVDDVLGYARDPEWSRYLRALPSPYERQHAEQFVARQVLLDRTVQQAWAIDLDGAAVGGIDLRWFFDGRVAELGYSLARVHWGRGFVPEAAAAVVDAAFRAWPTLRRVRAFADARNVASQRVMEKLSMRREGVLRQNRFERGELMDEAWYGVLREQWEART